MPASLVMDTLLRGGRATGPAADVDGIAMSAELRDGAFQLAGNSGVVVTAPQLIVPLFCRRGGRRFEAASPLVPPAISLPAAA